MISPAWLTPRCVRRASIIFQTQRKKIILTMASAILLLTCGIVRATPRQQGRAGGWVQPQGAGGYSGAGRFDGQRAARQPQRRQEHLPQWFRQHQYLAPQDQQRALRNEPGFNRLSPPEQQRLYNRLQQLNTMPPARRERTLQWMEALERLSPERRQQVRRTMQQVAQMPEDRQRMMHKAFQNLTQLPPEQRQAVLNSPQFKSQFSYQERQMLGTLMSVQPYVPEQRPGSGIEYGGKY
jgi:hypothetical protein